MAKINPTQIKPAELIRLLNSAGFGTVLTDSTLRRHRNSAGYTIGDAKSVDLLRYAAWLMQAYMAPPKPERSYEQMREAARQRNAELARAGQDIGEIPEVVNPERKAHAMSSFRFFCERYFPDVFYLPWSEDHLKVIDKIEQAVLKGGLFALAMTLDT